MFPLISDKTAPCQSRGLNLHSPAVSAALKGALDDVHVQSPASQYVQHLSAERLDLVRNTNKAKHPVHVEFATSSFSCVSEAAVFRDDIISLMKDSILF